MLEEGHDVFQVLEVDLVECGPLMRVEIENRDKIAIAVQDGHHDF